MLYQSLHVPDGEEPFPRSVLDNANIAHYLRDFGSLSGDDAQLCIGDSGNQVGAAWCRRLTSEDPGYGYVGDEVPELGMAVDANWRGRGVGRHLLEDLLARQPAMSLSVDNANTSATALYLSLGFVPVGVAGNSTTMHRFGPVGNPPQQLLDGVRRIAMSLPDVTERFSRGAPYFYVRRRALCYFHDAEFASDRRTTLWCPSPPGVADDVVAAEPTRFFHPTPSESGVFSSWLGMYLDSSGEELDWTEIAAVIEDAYRLVAPQHLVAQLDRR